MFLRLPPSWLPIGFTPVHSTLVLTLDHAYVQDIIKASKAQPAHGEPAGPKKARKAAPTQV